VSSHSDAEITLMNNSEYGNGKDLLNWHCGKVDLPEENKIMFQFSSSNCVEYSLRYLKGP
jgi:hypothetical protein